MNAKFVLFNEIVLMLLVEHKKGYWLAMDVRDGKTGMIKTDSCSPCYYPIIH